MFETAHDGHIPVEQNNVGHGLHTHVERDLTVFSLRQCKSEFFEDLAGNHSDDLGIVHNEASFHSLDPAFWVSAVKSGTPMEPLQFSEIVLNLC